MIARPDASPFAPPSRGTDLPGESGRASVLVAVRDARQELVAGCGATLLAVRTLDGCSCDVHERELLLLTGGVASGARALLSAFLGPAPRLRVKRRVAAGVQIRRAVIPAGAVRAIVCGWRDGDVPITDASARRVVYLLRARSVRDGNAVGARVEASHHTSYFEQDAGIGASWRPWAAALRRAGGAIVLAHEPMHGSAPEAGQKRRATVESDAPQDLVRESIVDGRNYASPPGGVRRPASGAGVRVLALAAGRIVSESAVFPE